MEIKITKVISRCTGSVILRLEINGKEEINMSDQSSVVKHLDDLKNYFIQALNKEFEKEVNNLIDASIAEKNGF